MDRKTVILLVVTLLGMLGINFFAAKVLFPPVLVPVTNAPAALTQNTAAIPGVKTEPPSMSAPGVVAEQLPDVSPNAPRRPEQLLALSNSAVRFVFTSHGGGLRRAELLGHKAFIPCRTSAGTW